MSFNFTNKVVIITGASSGIGAETAKRFAQSGAALSLVGRNASRLENVAQHCETLSGNPPLCILRDLTASGSCETVVDRTVEVYGRIDVLVNCAGKINMASLYDHSMEVFDEMLAINLRVPYHLTQLALPHLIRSKGSVVNIGSSNMKRYKPGFLPYVVAKTALEKFSEQASVEVVSEGVRINVVSPGVTRTNILENLNVAECCLNEAYNLIADELSTKLIIDPKEVANLICVVASDALPSMTGTNLKIDGAAFTT